MPPSATAEVVRPFPIKALESAIVDRRRRVAAMLRPEKLSEQQSGRFAYGPHFEWRSS